MQGEKMDKSRNKGQDARNIPDGPADGISLDVQSTHTRFRGKGSQRRMAKQVVVPGNIKASVELGVVSISDRVHDIMLTVRIEDMSAVMAGAYEMARRAEAEGSADGEKEDQVHKGLREDSHGGGKTPGGTCENPDGRQEDSSGQCQESI